MPLGKRTDLLSQKSIVKSEDSSSFLTPIPQSTGESTNEIASSEQVQFEIEEPKYDFHDVVLNTSTLEAIQDVLALYGKHDLLFNEWGLGATHKYQSRAGINLYGPSGTGKSMVAHAIAKQLNRKLLTLNYSQIESKYVGETSKNLVSAFNYAKETHAIIFFDEADALLSRRVTNMSNSTDVSVNQTRSVLLVLINDFNDLILFASNFISNYDPAFMRRILAHIKFEMPNEDTRLKLWQMYIPNALPTNANVKELSEKFSGISGSDIANAVLNASLRAARLNESIVHHAYFEASIENILNSKSDNSDVGTLVSKHTVSEEYVKSQFGGKLPK